MTVDLNTRDQRFTALYRSHYRAVKAYAWRRLPDLADDITAETFVVAWRRLGEVPAEELPWLLGVARKIMLNVAGRQRRLPETEELSAEQHAVFSSFPEDEALTSAMRRLPERDREILFLIAWEGLDTGSIAKILDCSRANVGLRLFRAKKRLKAMLSDAESSRSLSSPQTKEVLHEH